MDQQLKPKLKFRSSWDDGHVLDVKISQLLLQYDLPGIFYIPTSANLDDQAIKILDANGFEIGGHTETHPPDIKLLTDEQLKIEIGRNKTYLENVIGKKITSFCYPRGRYDERVVEAVKAAGFTNARTTKVLSTEVRDPFRTDTSIHVFQRKEYGGRDWVEAGNRMVEWASRTDGVFHIWGHGWEIERDDNWNKLELFFDWLRENYQIIPS